MVWSCVYLFFSVKNWNLIKNKLKITVTIYIHYKMTCQHHFWKCVLLTASQRQGCDIIVGDCEGCTWSQMRSHFFSLSYCRRRRALSGGRFIEFWKTRERFRISTHRKSCIPPPRQRPCWDASVLFLLGYSGFLSDMRNLARPYVLCWLISCLKSYFSSDIKKKNFFSKFSILN